MNEATEQLKPVEQIASQDTDGATWQAPGYEVVDTALEVTAYSLRGWEQTPACAAASRTHARRVAEPPTWLRHEGGPAPCDRTHRTPQRPPFGRTTGVCSQPLSSR